MDADRWEERVLKETKKKKKERQVAKKRELTSCVQESKVQKEARPSYESLTVENKGWKTNKDTCKEPDVKGEEEAWGEGRRGGGEGQLREVSHNPRSLSLTLTHCPSASCHSYRIHHPRHTSTSAQPHAAAFHVQHLSLEPYATHLTSLEAFSCATVFFCCSLSLN